MHGFGNAGLVAVQVQYRADGEARSLDSQSQSGGEKTMATIIYLTALQEQAKCPFRVVDEINQVQLCSTIISAF